MVACFMDVGVLQHAITPTTITTSSIIPKYKFANLAQFFTKTFLSPSAVTLGKDIGTEWWEFIHVFI